MLEYGVTFVALIVLYVIASFINPISRSVIQQVALIKYKEHGETKYQLLRSDKKILKELINKRNPNCLIQVDGGVNDKNIYALKEAGVDVVVAGSYVFGNDDYSKAIKSLQV